MKAEKIIFQPSFFKLEECENDMNSKIVNILVGGPVEEWPDELKNGQVSGAWVAVDRGAIRLLKQGIVPSIAVGDFDSINESEYKLVRSQIKEIKAFPPEKDLTDTQIGVITAMDNFDFDELRIYGATGGRLDHLLANVFLVLDPQFKSIVSKTKIVDAQNTISFYRPGNYTIVKEPDKKYLAFVNLTEVKGLTLLDEKYTLDHFDGNYPISWTSNEFEGTTNHFQFETGIVAVIQSKDK